nr:hypothetical protein [uncultured Arsenicibacter sp.]
MLPIHIALVSLTTNVSFSRLAVISAAIQKQIIRDFSPIWKIQATIDVFRTLEDMPAGYWPVVIVNKINIGTPGLHLDANGQPFALVLADDDIPFTCSHEILEMLVDPFGDRFVTSDSLLPEQGRVAYLVEVCDPCEGLPFGYAVNGLILSDFYTPHYFDPVANPAVKYSFSGAITRPREILKDGYISWRTFDTQDWFQANLFEDEMAFENLGRIEKDGRSWREIIDALTARPRELRMARLANTAEEYNLNPSQANSATRNASLAWAATFQKQLESML